MTAQDLLRRRPTAQDLANRIRMTVSPTGTLLVDGWSTLDWFSPAELAGRLLEFAPGQAHIFGANETLVDNADIAALAESGHATFWRSSLAEVLSELSSSGSLVAGPGVHAEPGQRVVAFGGERHLVPREILARVANFGELLDVDATADALMIHDEALYSSFREFLFSADRDPMWLAYARELAFARDHDAELAAKLDREIQRLGKGRPIRPIVVHGQACAGKSVTLQRLAFEHARRGEGAVVFLRRSHAAFAVADIDAVCLWAENLEAPYTLLVVDAMESGGSSEVPYAELLETLRARRRNVFIVGSAYGDLSSTHGLISQPARISLSEAERERFIALLRRVAPELEAVIRQKGSALEDDHLLSALYRWLPATRAGLRRSLKRELDHAAEVMASPREAAAVATTPLQRELLRVGLITEENLGGRDDEGSTPRRELVAELLGGVMIPAWLGVDAPVELILRTLKAGEDFQDFIDAIRATNSRVEIVRWVQERDGSLWLGARNGLEARLLVEASHPAEEDRADRIASLVRAIRPDETRGTSGGDEIGFAIRLLAAAAPTRGHTPLHPRTWRQLAEALSAVREESGIEEPRLMLREARLLRECAIHRLSELDPQDKLAVLRSAYTVAERGALVARDTDRHAGLRLSLYVEMQAAAGAIALQNIRAGNPAAATAGFGLERAAMREALASQKGSFYPISVATWTTIEMLSHDALEELEGHEALSELLAMYQGTTESDFDASQAEEYHVRRGELGCFTRDHAMSDASFERLLTLGSSAGVFRRAHDAARPREGGGYDDPSAGLDVISEFEDRVELSQDCIQLRLDLWWYASTGGLVFEGTNRTIPLDRQGWFRCLELVADVEATGDSPRSGGNLFRRALAHFHLGEFPRSVDAFTSLRSDRSVPGSRRLATIYVASTSAGEAQRYSGRVNLTGRDRRPRIYVNELGERVELDLNRFALQGVRGAQTLELFVGFSPQGAQAIPTTGDVAIHR